MSESLKDRLVVANDTKHLLLVREFMTRMIKQSRLPAGAENKITLAVDEAVTNIIEHGFDQGVEGQIEIEVETDPEKFLVVIRDNGRVFNPEAIPSPDMKEHVKLGRKKGLGLFLMRQIMDEVKYRFKDGLKNELTLVKYTR